MAVKTFYLTNALVGASAGAGFQQIAETSPGADATTSPNVGWTVGTAASGNFPLDSGTEATTTAVAATNGVVNATTGDCFRTTNRLSGGFASGNWTFTFSLIAVTNGGAQDGHIRFRLLKSRNTNGEGATQILGEQTCTTVTNLATAAAQSSTLTVNPGAFALDNEFLFVEVGWVASGAGGMTSADVIFRVGTTATRIVTSDYVTALSPFAGAASLVEGEVLTFDSFALGLSNFAVLFGAASAAYARGQSFAVAADTQLRAVRLGVYKVGSPVDSLTVTVWSGAIGTGTLLGTSEVIAGSSLVAGAPVHAADWTTFRFDTLIPLTAGTTYYFALSRSAAFNATNHYGVRYHSASAGNYSGATYRTYEGTDAGVWTAGGVDDDVQFRMVGTGVGLVVLDAVTAQLAAAGGGGNLKALAMHYRRMRG